MDDYIITLPESSREEVKEEGMRILEEKDKKCVVS